MGQQTYLHFSVDRSSSELPVFGIFFFRFALTTRRLLLRLTLSWGIFSSSSSSSPSSDVEDVIVSDTSEYWRLGFFAKLSPLCWLLSRDFPFELPLPAPLEGLALFLVGADSLVHCVPKNNYNRKLIQRLENETFQYFTRSVGIFIFGPPRR